MYLTLYGATILGFTIISFFNLNKNFDLQDETIKLTLPYIAWTILIVPIIEEISFRLILTRDFKKLLLGGSFFIANILALIIGSWLQLGKIITLFIYLTIAIIIFKLAKHSFSRQEPKSHNWNNYLLITVSSFTFGISHYITSPETSFFSFQTLILSTPYILRGFIYSMTRIKYGITYSILLHSLFNISVLFLRTLFN